MAIPKSLDPFALVRELVSRIESNVNARAEPILRSDRFLQNANRAMEAAMLAGKFAQELRQRAFEMLNLPSRSDVTALMHQLRALEDRMVGLQATLDRSQSIAAQSARPAPIRTRKPTAPTVEVVATPPPKRTRKTKP